MPESSSKSSPGETVDAERRNFLAHAASIAMAGGLIAGYGGFGLIAGRFLYPAGGAMTRWMFVSTVDRIKPGDSIDYRTPAGAGIAVTRLGDSGTIEDFIALSKICPHLGCLVHWEAQNNRFFCPCHNGVFDPSGKATAGPPAKAGQWLAQYSLKIEKGRLFIEVPAEMARATNQESLDSELPTAIAK